jgi:hypothetical protein
MFSSGGGAGGLPSINNPTELVIVLVVLVGMIWLGFKFFSD